MKTLKVTLPTTEYGIYIEKSLINKASELFNLNRKVLIVTDDGVPSEYAKTVAKQCKEPYIYTVRAGEGSKTLDVFAVLCREMMEKAFTRGDCVVAVGGGVVGDLAGFTAASYMRGVDFYNIPTTVLSAVDSSVGGKTGVNLDKIKNIVGAFKQPKGVLIDPELTKTLPERQMSNGLSEAVKMALTFDRELFELFELGSIENDLEEIIVRSLKIKISVVEQDERESGLRKVLNFGHTLGHGIESLGLGYYHGECVALGMLPMCSDKVYSRLIPVLEKLQLPTSADYDKKAAYEAIIHDKKAAENGISAVFCDEVGTFRLEKISPDFFLKV